MSSLVCMEEDMSTEAGLEGCRQRPSDLTVPRAMGSSLKRAADPAAPQDGAVVVSVAGSSSGSGTGKF